MAQVLGGSGGLKHAKTPGSGGSWGAASAAQQVYNGDMPPFGPKFWRWREIRDRRSKVAWECRHRYLEDGFVAVIQQPAYACAPVETYTEILLKQLPASEVG